MKRPRKRKVAVLRVPGGCVRRPSRGIRGARTFGDVVCEWKGAFDTPARRWVGSAMLPLLAGAHDPCPIGLGAAAALLDLAAELWVEFNPAGTGGTTMTPEDSFVAMARAAWRDEVEADAVEGARAAASPGTFRSRGGDA